jgi:HEPN domain-containing protein
MDANLQIDYWRESAAHDMEAAQTLFKNQKYDWCLFVGHLVIEKVLKAIYVRDKKEAPPWIHNLVRLAENTTLQLSEEQLMFLANVNDFNIESRSPDYKFSFYKTCTKEFTEEQFTRIQEMYQWLLSQMRQ